MEELQKNEITYDSDWKSVSTKEYAKINENSFDDIENGDNKKSNKNSKVKKNSPKQLLITIQLILCTVIALAAFILTNIGGSIYQNVREWYYSALNDSIIFEIGDNNLNLSELFAGATPDEI